MPTTRKIVLVASTACLAAMLYLWGLSDGREGKAAGLIDESFAAESAPSFSPVRARDRER